MQPSEKENQTSSSNNQSPSTQVEEVSRFSDRLLLALIAGFASLLLYVLIFSNSYAAIVGDVLLLQIMGDAYYHLDSERISVIVHTINAISWFLCGAIPFLAFKQWWLNIGCWAAVPIGLFACGFLMIIVAVSPLFP